MCFKNNNNNKVYREGSCLEILDLHLGGNDLVYLKGVSLTLKFPRDTNRIRDYILVGVFTEESLEGGIKACPD